MKIENWNGHKIRFVEVNGEWKAVAKDVSDALGYRDASNMLRHVDSAEKDTHKVSTPGGMQTATVIGEFGIYDAIWNSRKEEARDFKKWIKQVICELRKQSGLEGFQVFRMLDKEHQKEAMSRLHNVSEPDKKTYIKANVIANKAISNKYGYPKMVKKEQMTPQMMLERQPILDDTVNLMGTKDRFDLDLSVSEVIYRKWN